MYVYKESERGTVFTVGFYKPPTTGQDVYYKWIPESDHGSREEAARRVNYLNGGSGGTPIFVVETTRVGFSADEWEKIRSGHYLPKP